MTVMLTRMRLRATALLAVGLIANLGLAACGQWSPWARPGASATPAAPTATATPTPTPAVTPTPKPTATATPLGPLTGTWTGTWTNTAPVSGTGTFTLTWAQEGSRVVGAINILGSDCVTAGNVDGTAVGTHLRFGAVEGADTIEYDGTIVDANSISGTYQSPECGNAQGTWQASRNKP
jgi:hypothetical protein